MKMKPTTPCWVPADPDRYSETRQGGERIYLHRLMYRTFVGPLLDNMEITHQCDTPGCIRPDHLLQDDHEGNLAWEAAGRDVCVRGHPWTPQNTYRRKDRNGSRECRACKREDQKARYHRGSKGQATP